MRFLNTRTYLTLGLSSLVVTLMLAAAFAGLVPDRVGAIREGRSALAEFAAASITTAAASGQTAQIQVLLEFLLERNSALDSVGLRRADGSLVAQAGGHAQQWTPLAGQSSTDRQLQVPVYADGAAWGQLELMFAPIEVPVFLGAFEMPWLYLLAFVFAGSCLAFYVYLGRTLRHLDPSQAVPARVRAALDTLVEGLLVIDRKEQVVLANRAFAGLLGVQAESLVGRTGGSLDWLGVDGTPLAPEAAPWRRALRSNAAVHDTALRYRDAHGKLRSFIVNCTPVMSTESTAGGVLISLDDVTRLEENEAALREAKEAAEQANSAKSEFLANMSHEIRTPMNAVLGFTEVLRRKQDLTPQERARHLDTIHASGRHLLALINDILDLSKVEAGRLEVANEPCSPLNIAQETIRVLGQRAREKGLALWLEADGLLPTSIRSDEARLRQILTNLVGNAIKFTGTGEVTVRLRVYRDGSDHWLQIDVRDSGIGIAADKLAALFQPFVQADGSITRRFGGTGLGLALSRRFARAMGGDITVVSTEGRGSAFTVCLPAGALAEDDMVDPTRALGAAETKETTSPAWRFSAARVLVADDGPENRELLDLVLRDAGLAVDQVCDGQAACARASSERYDVILMDVSMPVMDGLTATRELRRRGVTTPILALTAHAMVGFDREVRAAGCDGYVTKPIDIDGLLEVLAGCLKAEQSAERRRASLAASSTAPERPTDQPERPPTPPAERSPVVSAFASNARMLPIVKRFVPRLREQITHMEAALTADDMNELGNLAHWLKGAGGTVGFHAFTTPAAALEQAAKAHDAAHARAMLQQVRDLAQRIHVPEPSDLAHV
jgi:PAS domain S-box-containing protein